MLNEHYDVTTAAYAVGYESYPISVGNIRGCLESHPREILIVWPTHQLSLMLVSNICHSPFRKFMLAEWLAAMFLLICGKKE